MSLEQIKRAVALWDEQQQLELLSYTLQLRYAREARFNREITDRLNDRDPAHWLTPEEFERRLDQN